jgi:hypothetical protein
MGKAVFIGLGGAGVYTAGHLKAKLLFEGYNGDEDELGRDCQFIFVDTDDDAVNTLNREYRVRFRGGKDLIAGVERVDLGLVNPYATYWMAKGKPENLRTEDEKQFLSWVDEKGSRQFMDQPLRNGAGANRQQGRVAVWDRFDEIRRKIGAALNVLQDIQNIDDYNRAYPAFYILSGTCGGTGSSAFLDVAYILDQEFKIKYPTFGAPVLRAVLFMPQWYIGAYRAKSASDLTIHDYHCNAYAFFDELKVLLKDRWIEDDGTKFSKVAAVRSMEYEKLELGKRKWPIFNFAFCIDYATEYGFTMSDQEMYRNTAELLYYWHLGSASATTISGMDDEKKEFPGTLPGRHVPAFFTIGYRALKFPEELMREYFERRFPYELFHYGLLGKDYKDALPMENVRREELDNTFKKAISRYLLFEAQEEGIPNLARSRREILSSYISSFTLSRFKRDRKDEIDPNKVSDSFLLDQLIKDAESLINSIKREMEREFGAPDSDTGSERLLHYIQQGYHVRPEEAPEGSLEVDIENAILRYGLNYAQEFVRRLDVRCEERVNSPQMKDDLTDMKEEKQSRRTSLVAEIDPAKKKCLSEKNNRLRVNALNELYNKLSEDIQLSAEVEIIEQQMQVLNRLSRGESGILDIYKRRIGELANMVRNRVEGSKEQRQVGLEDLYKSELPKRFLKTREDVTTTYLPDVADFVEGGGWKTDHLFARLYKDIVEQHPLPGGGEEPLRYGQNYGRHSDREGLHRILWDILTSPEYTNMDRGYEEHGHTNFFRRFFGHEASFEATELVSSTERFATNYIRLAMERSQNVRGELDRKMIERFNALTDEEMRLVKQKFEDKGTQTFCPMTHRGGENPTIYNVYAGDDVQLAGTLGYRPADTIHQFVQDNTPNRFLKIKVLTRHTLDMYPNYSHYENMYHGVKQRRQQESSIFAPHIHTLFNQLDASKGLKRACQATGEGLLDSLTQMLLYREMFETAFNDNRNLVEELIYIDDRFLGDEKTCHSHLITEGVGGGSSRNAALVCNKVDKEGNKLLLKRKNYLVVSGYVRHYKDIYDGISRLNYFPLLDALDEFDQHFRKNCTVSCLDIFEKALSSLQEKVNAGLNKSDVREFYERLNNSLITVSDSLRAIIERSRLAIAETKPEVEEKEGEELPV